MNLDSFRNYLVSRRIVTEKLLPFYILWVDRFRQFCGGPNADKALLEESIEPFPANLTKSHKDRQV